MNAEEKINQIASAGIEAMCDADIEECQEIIKEAEQMNGTNCWYAALWAKRFIIQLAKARLIELGAAKFEYPIK
jgi:hypothetical protein